MSSNQPQDGGDSPRRGLISSVMSIPSAIFNQGADHGRQWKDRAEGDNKCHGKWGACKRRRSHDDTIPAAAPKTSDMGAVDAEAWFSQVAKEFEKREQFAKDLYNNWNALDHADSSKSTSSNNIGSTSSDTHSPPIPDMEHAFDRLWSWPKRPGNTTQSEDTLFHPLYELTSSLENEIPQGLAFSGFGIPFMGRKLDPFLNDAIASGYSPLQLEQQEGFDNSWRVRFEDLVRVTNEQPMLGLEETDKVKRQTWSRWLVDFQSRNAIPSHSENFSRCPMSKKRQELPHDSQWAFEGPKMRDLAREAWGKGKEEKQDLNTDATKSWFQMSSMVETRNSHTNPDGSVTTTINMTKRFPDGRVEKSERTETTPAPSRQSEQQRQKSQQVARQADDSSKKGWFWSR